MIRSAPSRSTVVGLPVGFEVLQSVNAGAGACWSWLPWWRGGAALLAWASCRCTPIASARAAARRVDHLPRRVRLGVERPGGVVEVAAQVIGARRRCSRSGASRPIF